MKRVVLDGLIVSNVEVVDDDATGLIVPDDCWVGPGCIWNGDTDELSFAPPHVTEPEVDQ